MLDSLSDIQILEDEFLGEGAFSTVHLVRSKKDSKKYALKRMNIKNLNKKDIEAIKEEIKVNKLISHPNILKFVDCLQVGSNVYLLLEFAQNGALFFFIHASLGLPRSVALKIFKQTVQALDYLHSHNIVHRDLKPENILVDKNFNSKLSDFGSACILSDKSLRESICGTYEYMSPEVMKLGASNHDEKTDIWALGILLYEMLEGSPPFSANSLKEAQEAYKENSFKLKKEKDPRFQTIIDMCLKYDKHNRANWAQILKYIETVFDKSETEITSVNKKELYKSYKLNTNSSKSKFKPTIVKEFERIECSEASTDCSKSEPSDFFDFEGESFFNCEHQKKNENFFDVDESFKKPENTISSNDNFFENIDIKISTQVSCQLENIKLESKLSEKDTHFASSKNSSDFNFFGFNKI